MEAPSFKGWPIIVGFIGFVGYLVFRFIEYIVTNINVTWG